ncbi:BON domain-containing protein [Chamaesiphon sp. VAR_48_metabat_403]|uniref:BON domain-containing protein n=1 Tax=Chamaesiphon sp. VAR_48_metabat_403 TaxID=2964700 RepID=UPI00286E1BCB|nr:BON domain-containing protein [Chamaesiphon sp. VAR_48_metabat_403]
MNQNTKPSFIQPLVLSILLATTISACSTAKTSSNAPNANEGNGQTTSTEDTNNSKDDAQNPIRKKQIESDIRAREQRNNIGGNPQVRSEEDLESEVRGKLEANIPNSKLSVDAKNADVTVSGSVANQAQLDKIKPLALQIKGVKNVLVKAAVKP